MKKLCLILLICCFMTAFAEKVFADRNRSSFSARTTSGLIKRGDWKIYRISFIATTGGHVGDVVDMEAYALAKVCLKFDLSFIAFKCFRCGYAISTSKDTHHV